MGVMVKGNGVQVVYGPKVTVIKSNIEDYLKSNKQSKKRLTPIGRKTLFVYPS